MMTGQYQHFAISEKCEWIERERATICCSISQIPNRPYRGITFRRHNVSSFREHKQKVWRITRLENKFDGCAMIRRLFVARLRLMHGLRLRNDFCFICGASLIRIVISGLIFGRCEKRKRKNRMCHCSIEWNEPKNFYLAVLPQSVWLSAKSVNMRTKRRLHFYSAASISMNLMAFVMLLPFFTRKSCHGFICNWNEWAQLQQFVAGYEFVVRKI